MSPVCFIVYNVYLGDPRVTRYAQTLLEAGYEVDVFAVGRPQRFRPGLTVVDVLPGKVFSQRAWPSIASQLRFLLLALFRVGLAALRRRYGVVHVHNMPDFIVFAALIPKLLGAKVILDIHDTAPEAYATKFNLPLDAPLISLVRLEERVSAAFATRVITTNDLHKMSLMKHGIPSDKIDIILNLADRRLFHPNVNYPPRKGLTLIYHGTVAQRLGLDLILDALRRARPECPDLRFVLMGDGEYMPEVKRLIAAYQLEDVVTVSPVVPVEDLPAILSRADLGIIGNRLVTEVRQNWMLPVKMLEYAAMEIPTIAPRLRIIEHYFDDSNTLFYDPDNAEDLANRISQVYHNPKQLEPIRKGLQAFNARYNWAEMANQYVSLVRSFEAHTRRSERSRER